MRIYYQKERENQEKREEIHQIDVSLIVPNPNQPRKVFTEESIIKLADSIRQYGIIQPLIVRKAGDFYELVAGERRLRASKELGLATVPCVISDVTEVKSAEISIIENLLREDLNIFEQAEAIRALIDTYNLTQEEVASRLSNSQSFVANKLRLLRFSAVERDIIIRSGLTERHARALLRVNDPVLRDKLLGIIVTQGLNVSAAEQLIESQINGASPKRNKNTKRSRTISAFYSSINRAIESIREQGIEIKSRRVESDDYTELVILVPNKAKSEEEALV